MGQGNLTVQCQMIIDMANKNSKAINQLSQKRGTKLEMWEVKLQLKIPIPVIYIGAYSHAT